MSSMTIRQRCNLALFVAVSIAPTVLWAFPIEQIPNPRKIEGNWVSDVANILQPETEKKLNTLINQLKEANGSEMAVVTVPDSAPFATPKELTTKLFNTWGIGQKGKDNGLLFLVSVSDHRVEIETGYGIEVILSDAQVGRIIEQKVTPAFKSGNFDAGTLSGTETIAQLLQGKDIDLNSKPWNSQSIEAWFVLVIWRSALFITLLGACLLLACPHLSHNLAAGLQTLAGLALVRGLGKSVKLHPRQSSREKAWHLRFETAGAMHCAVCGGALEPVEDDAVERIINPNEKAAVALGSLQFRGWRCRRCAPEAMHLRGYESTSKTIERCPKCQELTVISEAPYVIPSTSPPGPDLLITRSHCVSCDYTPQERLELRQAWNGIDVYIRGWGGLRSGSGSGSDFGGGSSGGGGAGGSW